MPTKVSMLALVRQSSQVAESQALSPDDANNNSNSSNSGGNDAGNDNDPSTGATTAKKTRKRVRHFTSNDRAAHRVFERARREAFREKLIVGASGEPILTKLPVFTNVYLPTQELAELLPSLEDADASRLSKHMVVHESISRHHEQVKQIDDLTRERDELRAELARWRTQAGFAGPVPEPSLPGSEAGLSLSPPLSLSLPLSLPFTMPPEQQQQATAPGLLLGDTSLPLPLGMGQSHNVPNIPGSAPWSWSPPFNLHRDLGEAEAVMPWGNLDDADIGQLVVDSLGQSGPPMAAEMTRNDGHREIQDTIVVNTGQGIPGVPPEQMLWMVT